MYGLGPNGHDRVNSEYLNINVFWNIPRAVAYFLFLMASTLALKTGSE
jgi:hypothetical protein